MKHTRTLFADKSVDDEFKAEINRMKLPIKRMGRELLEKDPAEVAGRIIDESGRYVVPTLGGPAFKAEGKHVICKIPYEGEEDVLSVVPSDHYKPSTPPPEATYDTECITIVYEKMEDANELRKRALKDIDQINVWLEAIQKDFNYFNATQFDVIYQFVQTRIKDLNDEIIYENELNRP